MTFEIEIPSKGREHVGEPADHPDVEHIVLGEIEAPSLFPELLRDPKSGAREVGHLNQHEQDRGHPQGAVHRAAGSAVAASRDEDHESDAGQGEEHQHFEPGRACTRASLRSEVLSLRQGSLEGVGSRSGPWPGAAGSLGLIEVVRQTTVTRLL